MNRWLPALILFAALLGTFFFFQQPKRGGRAGFPAPDFVLPDLQGQAVRLSDHRGKIVFLNLWATWCPPCREEMPSMQRLYQQMSGRDFVMLAVSEDYDVAAVAAFAQQMRLSFPILLDTKGELPPRYGVTGYPETFIIDRNGNVIEHIIGPENWDSPNAINHFHNLLSLPVTESAPSDRGS
jgi:peroxiredoxin